jgi:uncharacterized protein YodC (DUF2158 family)
MAERKFNIGDTVRLKSGGPLMTVTELTNDLSQRPSVKTLWFDKGEKECNGSYLEAVLNAEVP